jgi:hypothetical protein
MGINRDSKYKHKKRSCKMCKPHKMGFVNRWKIKIKQTLKETKKEIL